jgi:GT2 family glycosyltransferase
MTPRYSIVIPSRDGGDRLLEVLAALERQEGAPPFEILVADDGSTDGTPERVEAGRWRTAPRLLRGTAGGPAVARNRGVAAAAGDRVAFLGDDTVPDRGWLAAHDQAWERNERADGVAVIGFTGWHPRIRQTAFRRYLNEEGLQFGFGLIADPERVPFNFFYTSNLSLSRTRIAGQPFDEAFPYPAWEDIEAAYRLVRDGLRIVYAPEARAWHDHPTDFARFAARQERAGYSAVVFWQRHPELGPFLGLSADGPPRLPSIWRQRRREALVRALQNLPVPMRRLWSETLRFHYLRGLHRGWRERVENGGTSR